MATPTYDPIASTTLTSSASSVTFSSLDTIAAGYRDLVLVVQATATTSFASFFHRFNGDSGSNYNRVWMYGDGSSTASQAQSSVAQYHPGNFRTAVSQGISHIMDFSATDKHKSIISRVEDTGIATYAAAGRWANTSAITSIEIFTSSNAFAAGSTFSLYGIAA